MCEKILFLTKRVHVPEVCEEKRGMVIGVRLVGSSMPRTTNLLNVSKITLSSVMTAYIILGKVSSA